MQSFFSELKFYESYSFSQAVQNILYNQFEYLRGLDEFYGDENYLSFTSPFPKYSALHRFIEFIVNSTIHDENCKVDLEKRKENIIKFVDVPMAIEELRFDKLPIEEAFKFYSIEHTSFIQWLEAERNYDFHSSVSDDIYEYLSELSLCREYELLIEKIVREVFFILFQNRNLLLVFNDMMARQIERSEVAEIDEDYLHFFARSGKLKRVAIPKWVKRAVFFRDRGLCVLCNRDLSGLVNIENAENYDHIVPLAQGGLNDVTNIQLLCKDCNMRKLHYSIETSTKYQLWYPITDLE